MVHDGDSELNSLIHLFLRALYEAAIGAFLLSNQSIATVHTAIRGRLSHEFMMGKAVP